MMDRFRAHSSLLALAIASVGVLSACDQGKPDEPTQVKTSAVLGGLQSGDLAVTCTNSTTDEVQIVSLVALPSGTDIKFTDNEWSGTGWVAFDETTDYAIPVPSAVTPGQEIPFIPGGGAPTTGGISNNPEQFFIYQGSIQADGGGFNLVWGMQTSTAGVWGTTADGGALGNNISALPTDLANANIALGSSNPTFWAYTGTTSGTKAQLLAALKNTANWTGPNAVDGGAPACPGAFTVIPDVVDSGAGNDSSTGTAGAGGSDSGAGGMVGTADSGAGGSTDSGANPDAPADSGAGGTVGTDGGAADTGAGGAAGTDSGAPDTGSMVDAKVDTGSTVDTGATVDAKTDTGSTADAKVDTGSTADAKTDTGSTGGTDAKTSVDAGKDSGTAAKSSSGCGCSTASNSQNLSASVSLLALAGIVMTTRRRRRR